LDVVMEVVERFMRIAPVVRRAELVESCDFTEMLLESICRARKGECAHERTREKRSRVRESKGKSESKCERARESEHACESERKSERKRERWSKEERACAYKNQRARESERESEKASEREQIRERDR